MPKRQHSSPAAIRTNRSSVRYPEDWAPVPSYANKHTKKNPVRGCLVSSAKIVKYVKNLIQEYQRTTKVKMKIEYICCKATRK